MHRTFLFIFIATLLFFMPANTKCSIEFAFFRTRKGPCVRFRLRRKTRKALRRGEPSA